jgi:hypothetical protein
MADTINIAVSSAQFTAIRALSLKYENVTPEQYANKLFAQVVRNYFKTSLKASATKAGEQWDAAKKLGFDTKLTRDEYVARAVKTAKDTWVALNANSGADLD